MQHPATLLTGATGLLGSYLLRDLLVRHVPLAVLVRPTRKQSGRDRIEALVTGWEAALGRSLPRPTVLEGDLTGEACGLSSEALRWTQHHCGQVLNNAASLTFHGRDRAGEPWRTNVGGSLDSVTVYRPSIIVGDSMTGYTSTYHGYFAVLRLGHTLLSRVSVGSTSGRTLLELLGIPPHACKNFVPVDWVSAVISTAVTDTAVRGKTLRVTHPLPLSMEFIAGVVQEAVETYSTAAEPDAADRCDERWFADHLREQLAVYAAYFRNDPVFDTSTLERHAVWHACPTLDRDVMLRMSEVAIAQSFGRQTPDLIASGGLGR